MNRSEFEATVRSAILGEIEGVVDQDALAVAIESGDYNAILDELGITDETESKLTVVLGPTLREVFETTALEEAAHADIDIDLLDLEIVPAIRAMVLGIVELMMRRAMETVVGVTTRGYSAGWSPELIAMVLSHSVWMPDSYAAGVQSQAQRMLEQEIPFPAVEAAVVKTAMSRRRHWVDGFSVWAVTSSITRASRYAWSVQGGDYEIEWWTRRDEMVCPICGAMHGVRIPSYGMFDTSVGQLFGPPAHDFCRCRARRV